MEARERYQVIAKELGLAVERVQAAVELMDEGNTIPFIARYRKERTKEMDEEVLRSVEERNRYLIQLGGRKEEVLRLIDDQGKLNDELKARIEAADKLQTVEDLYRPYRPKRKTRASIARERGLAPLAEHMLAAEEPLSVDEAALRFVDSEKGVEDAAAAIQGAMDIIAEDLADDADIRKWVRDYTWKNGILASEAKDGQARTVYEMYYDRREPVRKMPSHRVLAVNRGEREEVLKLSIEVEEEAILRQLEGWFPKKPHPYLKEVAVDSWKRLIFPSVEREIRAKMTEAAEEQAIHIFAENLRKLLLQPPIRGKKVLGVDPAYRTGCKLAVVDDTGRLQHVGVVYPTLSPKQVEEAKQTVRRLIEEYSIDLIAIGNGTASRETESFIAELMREVDRDLYYIMVNEAGASVYSASKLAREEFPDLDVAQRSAVSIARRLQDPLAELVKIEPKAVGVGQYQHDVSQKRLTESLGTVVESAVNHVGVDVNTASAPLLSYVAGVNTTVAKNIIKYREELGRYGDRKQLKKVPRLGAKTFEQCIGFLRVIDGENPLDKTPIHPESYPTVEKLLTELDSRADAIGTPELNERLRRVDITAMASVLDCGVPTLRDIIEALLRPGRDPREELPTPVLRSDVLQLEDLKEGLELKGTVRNVVDFGAFVDIGLKNDGLVHISKMSDKFVKHPMDVVGVGDIVDVWVINVDHDRERVSLSMIPNW
ncbi:Tex family protein [Salinithrix halophila]|uniref:Tex family protein n=1 Tax=Salinithrix halophila TaxID=1485204 RepID=A0ABV8JDN1_9BACL